MKRLHHAAQLIFADLFKTPGVALTWFRYVVWKRDVVNSRIHRMEGAFFLGSFSVPFLSQSLQRVVGAIYQSSKVLPTSPRMVGVASLTEWSRSNFRHFGLSGSTTPQQIGTCFFSPWCSGFSSQVPSFLPIRSSTTQRRRSFSTRTCRRLSRSGLSAERGDRRLEFFTRGRFWDEPLVFRRPLLPSFQLSTAPATLIVLLIIL